MLITQLDAKFPTGRTIAFVWDTGSPLDIVSDRSLLFNFVYCPKRISGLSSEVVSPGYGTVYALTVHGEPICIENVWYLNIGRNILSGCSTRNWSFNQSSLTLLDSESRVIGTAVNKRHIYVHLNYERCSDTPIDEFFPSHTNAIAQSQAALVVSTDLEDQYSTTDMEYHIRTGHTNSYQYRMLRKLDPTLPKIDSNIRSFCLSCKESTMSRQRRGRKGETKITQPLQVVHADVAGQITPVGLGGEQYFLVVVDRFTRMTYVEVLLIGKRAEDALRLIVARMHKDFPEHRVKEIRVDNGLEFHTLKNTPGYKDIIVPEIVEENVEFENIHRGTTAPYSSFQNGVAERCIRSVCRKATTLLSSAGLPLIYWPDAIRMAVYIMNFMPREDNGHRVPFTFIETREFKLPHDELSFGCLCTAHRNDINAGDKFSPRAVHGIYLGPLADKKASRYVEIDSGHLGAIHDSRQVSLMPYFKPFANQILDDYYDPRKRELIDLRHPHVKEAYAEASVGKKKSRGSGKKKSVLRPVGLDLRFVVSEPLAFDKLFTRGNALHEQMTEGTSRSHLEMQSTSLLSSIQDVSGTSPSTLDLAAQPDKGASLSTEDCDHEMEGQSSLHDTTLGADDLPEMVSNGEDTALPAVRSEIVSGVSDLSVSDDTDNTISSRTRFRGRKMTGYHKALASGKTRPTKGADDGDLVVQFAQFLLGGDEHDWFENFSRTSRDFNYENFCAEREFVFFTDGADLDIPKHYDEAMLSPDLEKWAVAVEEEIDAFQRFNTFDVCDLPAGRKAISSRWVFTRKFSGRLKARLVAQGFLQQEGIDFNETYSPVAKYHSVKIALAIAAAYGMTVCQVDVKTAFLQSEIDNELYLKIPRGFETRENEGKVFRIQGSLYGLKQAPRLWNAEIDSTLKDKLHFTANEEEPCLYFKRAGSEMVMVVLYVDDMLIMSTSDLLIAETKQGLKAEYTITEEKVVTRFLGMTVNCAQNAIKLSLEDYINDKISPFVSEDTGIGTPWCPTWGHLEPWKDEEPFDDPTRYRTLVGRLLFASATVRFDIAFAVGVLSRYVKAPAKKHMKAALRIARYLKFTAEFGLTYGPSESIDLEFYTDADWGGARSDGKSITGMMARINKAPIYWKAKGQNAVALSTSESEAYAFCETAKEAQWMSRLLTDLKVWDVPRCIPIFTDNQSVLNIIAQDDFWRSERTKHICIRWHFVRQGIRAGIYQAVKVHTDDNRADICTKGLGPQKFPLLRDLCNC